MNWLASIIATESFIIGWMWSEYRILYSKYAKTSNDSYNYRYFLKILMTKEIPEDVKKSIQQVIDETAK